jgi:predicted ABC-type transport system involved in lysophospholipase L1 biosynthesis ATPase subunit
MESLYAQVAMTVLQLEGVGKRFPAGPDEIAVLDRVELEVEPGDFVGIHGGRRAGKSILLRVAAGWEQPDEGAVRYLGEDIWALPERARARLRRRHGVVLASGSWRPSANRPVLRHLQEALACDRVSLREAVEPAHRALERVGLARLAYTPSAQLSQGELVRLGIALRLIHRPRVLLVDEPAVLLRPGEAAELEHLLRRLGTDPDLALVVASEEIAPIRIARRRFSLDDGALRSMDRAKGRLIAFPERRRAGG